MELVRDLERALGPEKVHHRMVDRLAFASDASFYALVPEVVVRPDTIEDVVALFGVASRHGCPVTIRAAGTSLSGQAVTDGILADISRGWRTLQVEEGGARVRVGPGVVGGWVNQHLRAHHRKIGPDPASIGAAMMGGILANNSSGMCCGVADNAYHTLHALTAVLPGGHVLRTGDPDADTALAEAHPEICETLLALRRQILDDPVLLGRIRSKYRLKNTVGYALNALVDHERPAAILAHLLIGSEGTLGFIAEATLRTVPAPSHRLTALLFFGSVHDAGAAVPHLRAADAVELMDRASLRSIQSRAGRWEPIIDALAPEAAALLVEYGFDSPGALAEARPGLDGRHGALPLVRPAALTDDPAEQVLLWSLRKGLYPSVGAVRKVGTTVVIEDVVAPVERLADLILDLRRLLDAHGYPDAILFGHARDGNLHFVLTQAFDTPEEVARYDALIRAVVDLVVHTYDGSLKGEHGTGRNMAPFVQTEWGPEAVAIMARLKAVIDPEGICNPGVILDAPADAHVRHLKVLPEVDPVVDLCTECGYCESRCPSRDLTFTPRQRIAVQRHLRRLEAGGEGTSGHRPAYWWASVTTCATDGLCGLACPVGIDTGQYVKGLRAGSRGPVSRGLANQLASRFPVTQWALRAGLSAARLAPRGAVEGAVGLLRHAIPLLPRVPEGLGPPPPLRLEKPEHPEVLYFQTCISRTMGAYPGQSSLGEVVLRLSERAGIAVEVTPSGFCCGMPFASKGFADAQARAVERTVAMLFERSRGGALPVVVDVSPCTLALRQSGAVLGDAGRECLERLEFLDSIDYAHRLLLPRLAVRPVRRSVVLHPVCSVQKMGLVDTLRAVAAACAEQVTVPEHAGCCGMAGDRGLMVPALVEAATRLEAEEIRRGHHDGCYSSSRTCEHALSGATGTPFLSVLHLLDEASTGG